MLFKRPEFNGVGEMCQDTWTPMRPHQRRPLGTQYPGWRPGHQPFQGPRVVVVGRWLRLNTPASGLVRSGHRHDTQPPNQLKRVSHPITTMMTHNNTERARFRLQVSRVFAVRLLFYWSRVRDDSQVEHSLSAREERSKLSLLHPEPRRRIMSPWSVRGRDNGNQTQIKHKVRIPVECCTARVYSIFNNRRWGTNGPPTNPRERHFQDLFIH